MGSSKDEAVRSAASAGDSFLKAAPIWNSFAMMCATYTLYQAPFWDKLLQSGMGIEIDGSYQQLLVSCVNYGVLFVLIPGMLADRYSCFPTALVGAGLAATGYTVLGMGWVTVGSGGSSRVAVAATVSTFAFGVAWIYASAFVTAITTADDAVRGRVVGVAMCGFYASSAWFTEVTEYCCDATTTAETSAWRHMPIALTALICSPGLATSYRKSGSVSSKDVGMTTLYCSIIVAMSLGAYQWNVTGGFGSQDLSSFAYGDITFMFLIGYIGVSTFCAALNVRNYAKYGITMGGSSDDVSDQVETKELVPPSSTLESKKYQYLSVIFAVNVGLGQTTGNTWEHFDDLFHGKQTESWKMWFPSMAAAALFTGLLIDQKMVDKTTMLCVSLSVLTVAQGIFSMATVDESMTSTDTNWPFLTLPYEHIPLIATAMATGVTCTTVPLLEVEWFGSKNIGGMHGIDMLGAIATQVFFYNGVANVAPLSTQMWLQTAASAVGLGFAFALRSEAKSDETRSEEAREEAAPLVVSMVEE
mmetsp:Transcript_110221/g.320993  ORF Transcript_110221/g.320993 Transcript_110221/m.320993 type:complete len:530 (-) Transcript_110221:84-1673(-)